MIGETKPFRHRLAVQQALLGVGVALLLGIFSSAVQIALDYRHHRQTVNQTVAQVLRSVEDAATLAAYNLDEEAALRVVNGLIQYPPLVQASLADENGKPLASAAAVPTLSPSRWRLFAREPGHTVKLYSDSIGLVGHLLVETDPDVVADAFLNRAGVMISSGLLRNFFLAWILFLVINHTLTRHIVNLYRQLRADEVSRLQLPDRHRHNELGELVQAFNDRLHLIRTQKDQIESDRQQLQQRVQERTLQLQDSVKELEAFCYSVSHDLRAPLRAINGFARLIAEDFSASLPPETQPYLARIISNSEKMAALINDLLQLSRITVSELNFSAVDLTRLAQDFISNWRQQTPAQVIEFDCQPDLICTADSRFMSILVGNLLSNALKYSARQPVSNVKFYQTQVNGKILYHIEDNGVGFDTGRAQKLFAPFQRFHLDQDFEGTGIGLAIVERIVRRHGGEIEVESEIGTGTHVMFTLGPERPSLSGVPE